MNNQFVADKVLVFEDLPVQAQIDYVGLPSAPKAKIRIYGVSKQLMDEITTIQLFSRFIQNRRVRLSVDEGDGYQVLFDGGIMNAVPMYYSAPNVYIQIESSALMFQQFEDIPPFSIAGTMSVFDVINGICKDYGMKAENYMKSQRTVNSGVFDQAGFRARITAAERALGVKCAFMTNNTVKVLDEDNPKLFTNYNLTSADYVGYPTFNSCGVEVVLDKMLPIECYDTFTISGSEVGFANTTWRCYKKTYNLQTLMNNSKWELKLMGVYNVLES